MTNVAVGDFVIGRVIRATGHCWHPKCFKCVNCHKELADIGFVKNQGRPLCKQCNSEFKGTAILCDIKIPSNDLYSWNEKILCQVQSPH